VGTTRQFRIPYAHLQCGFECSCGSWFDAAVALDVALQHFASNPAHTMQLRWKRGETNPISSRIRAP